jgi:hypothetical protein
MNHSSVHPSHTHSSRNHPLKSRRSSMDRTQMWTIICSSARTFTSNLGPTGQSGSSIVPPDIWLDNGVLFISFCRYLHGAKATILFLFSLLFYFFSNTCLPTCLPTYLLTYLPPTPPPLRCSYLHTYVAMFCSHWIEVGLKVLYCNDTCVCFVKQASSCSGI